MLHRTAGPALLSLAPLALLLLLFPGGPPSSAEEPEIPAGIGRWEEIDSLVEDGRARAALDRVIEIRDAAIAAGDEAEWTRALFREAELRTNLRDFEGAVTGLRAQPWPEGPAARVAVELLYAESLAAYQRASGWQIGQRPPVDTGAELPLERWSTDRIFAAADDAFRRIWSTRAVWQDEPASALHPYLIPNDFPPGIRDTLRDTIVYAWVGLLTDTTFWTPEEADRVHRLDLARLLSGPVSIEETPDRAPGAHPLVRAAALLADLETWHEERGEPEAAFEAALERISRVRAALSDPDDREAARDALRRRLDELGRARPWGSRGAAVLAAWTFERGGLDDAIAAHALAAEGAAAHPASIGGRQCAAFLASLEAPDYALEAMPADGPRRRSIRVQHRNLDRLWFRAYAFDLAGTIERPRAEWALPLAGEIPAIVAERSPAAAWSVEPAATPDFRVHATYVTPPLDEPGLYLVVASAREDFALDGNRRQATWLMVSDLVLLTRTVGDQVEVTALSGATGEPRPGTRLALYSERLAKGLTRWERGRRPRATAVADADGRARLRMRTAGGLDHLLVGRHGDQQAIARGDLSWYYRKPDLAPAPPGALVYTDRGVYRPGQTILWKVAAYSGTADEGSFRTLPAASIGVTLVDSQGDAVERKAVTTNDFGTASGRFEVPPGRLLGRWTIRVDARGRQSVGWAQISVEEYERPTFEVTLDPPEDAPRLGRETEVGGSVRYYFGLPVVNGRVAWQVTREPVYTFVWPPVHHWPPAPAPPSRVVAAGTAELDADGRFRVRFVPEADERDAERADGGRGVHYRYRLSADVTDEGGETRSAERAYPIGFVAVRAILQAGEAGEAGGPERGFFGSGEPVRIGVLRTDLDGEPRAGDGHWRLVGLTPPARAAELGRPPLPAEQPAEGPLVPYGFVAAGRDTYRTPGDLLRPRWAASVPVRRELAGWSEGAEVAAGDLRHGDDGRARMEAGPLPAGAYRLLYSTEDRFGARYETGLDVLVARPGADGPALAGVLLAERSSVPVGGTARLLVHSGLPDQEMVLEIHRGTEVTERRRLRSDGGMRVVELPVDPGMRGGFGATLTLVHDHQVVRQEVSIEVPWDDRRLAVELSTFRDRLRPGDREEWRLSVRGPDGEPLGAGAAEVLASMYDRSLDLFARHATPDALALYPRRYGSPRSESSLDPMGLAWSSDRGWAWTPAYPWLRSDRLRLFADGGVGGPGGPYPTARDPWNVLTQAPGFLADRITVVSESPALRALGHVGGAREESSFAVDGVVITDMAAIGASPTYYDFDPFEELQGRSTGAKPGPGAIRTRFAETAFFEPHLLTDAAGGVTLSFTVPDSVTEWRVWARAITRDLAGGSVEGAARSVKELQVRPYLPRFLREGDRAEVRVVVDNSGAEPLAGTLDVELFAPGSIAGGGDEGRDSLLAAFGLSGGEAHGLPFEVPAGDSVALTFLLTVPRDAAATWGAGGVAFRATARAGDLGDGEQRPLPILPSRVRLAQSRTAALDGAETEVLRFPDLAAAAADPTLESESLVVTLDGQLFYGVLGALPYLVDYPHECTEQTLNRFVSTSVVGSVFERYPAVAAMAQELAARESWSEAWSEDDANRSLARVETPWLAESRGDPVGDRAGDPSLLRILDPRIAAAQRDAALARLREAQTASGAFPWFPGGEPSAYMTLYILQGLARAEEAGVAIPDDLRRPAWGYLHRLFLDEWLGGLARHGCCRESTTFLAYLLSSEGAGADGPAGAASVFTAAERRRLLDLSFEGWRDLAPRLKLMLAVALHRDGRTDDARRLVESVMDSAVTTEDEGTYWAPEPRSWLWYHDTVETHAFALRTLNEVAPDDPRRRGLAQWLFLDKQLGHWKSTRATAEAIYALIGYLESPGGESELAVREEIRVAAGPEHETFVFEPDEYTGGHRQLVIPGERVTPETAEVTVAKETPGFAFATATWWFSTEVPPASGDGDLLAVERSFFLRRPTADGFVLEPLADGARVAVGDQVEVHLTLRARHAAEYVHLRDPRGAGFEPESLTSGHRWDGIGRYEEVRDSGANFFFERLPAGEHTLRHRLRASLAGTFRVGPATVQSIYAPEHDAYSAGAELRIEPGPEGVSVRASGGGLR